MDKNISRLLQELADTAATAADSARAAVLSAKEAVSDKYDSVKLNLEYSRLEDEQEDVFSDIGRMLFLMHTGKVGDTVVTDEGEKSPQQVIDALLLSAEQLQQQMDAIGEKLGEDEDELPEGVVCPKCGNVCFEGDRFCCACGARLEPPTAEAPVSRPQEAPVPQDGTDSEAGQ